MSAVGEPEGAPAEEAPPDSVGTPAAARTNADLGMSEGAAALLDELGLTLTEEMVERGSTALGRMMYEDEDDGTDSEFEGEESEEDSYGGDVLADAVADQIDAEVDGVDHWRRRHARSLRAMHRDSERLLHSETRIAAPCFAKRTLAVVTVGLWGT